MKIKIVQICVEPGDEYDLPIRNIISTKFYKAGGDLKAIMICEVDKFGDEL